jgi:UDP-glucose 4-epimerase
MRYFVTGGAGFVGAPLVHRLERGGHEVVVYDNLSRGSKAQLVSGPGFASGALELIEADVLDDSTLSHCVREAQPEIVVHLAAMHFIPDCEADPAACLEVNVGGTQAVIDAVGPCPSVRRLLFASSAAVYRPSAEAHDEEASELGPTDIYGSSKLSGEVLLGRFNRRFPGRARIARLFNVFGPGETNPHLIPAILTQALDSDRLLLGDLSTKRDYIYTDDVAAAFERLACSVLPEGLNVFNIGAGQERSGSEVVGAVGQLLGRGLQVVADRNRLRPSDRPNLLADTRRAAEYLSWRPLTSFDQGLSLALRHPMATSTRLSEAV